APVGAPRHAGAADPAANRVGVGPAALLSVGEVVGRDVAWLAERSGRRTDVTVQVRAHGEAVPASVELDGDRLVGRLSEPLRGVAAGQSLVVYDGTRVLGQASVEIARRARGPRAGRPRDGWAAYCAAP